MRITPTRSSPWRLRCCAGWSPGSALSRPERLAVVCGTATDVGKTWVACSLLRDLRCRGFQVAARKPAQSFADDGQATDAELLAAASGAAPRDVCPAHRWYPAVMAPQMAAAALGLDS